MKPLTVILIGAGERGANAYGAYGLRHPEQIRFVAVAEPDPQRRARFAQQHQIDPANQFPDWEPLLQRPQLAEAALICTQDSQHTAPTLATLRAGYHVLLEKPMATTAEECIQLVETANQAERQLQICHVLRYTRHFQAIRQILQSGVLGQIITIDHRENVSWWHMAHSYVRGNWRSRAASSPMILAKCCHDLDILVWLLGRRCESLSSAGGLRHYRPENAPANAPPRCLDGCPASDTCPYYAPFIYVDLLPLWRNLAANTPLPLKLALQAQQRAPGLVKALASVAPPLRQLSDYRGWPRSVVAQDATPEQLLEALRSGPYGRCVYHCDNDVVDHQVVAMDFEGGISATLAMHGHSHYEERTTRIQGSRGELLACFGAGGAWVEVRDHRSGQHTRQFTGALTRDGHGGGDSGLMQAFVGSLRGKLAIDGQTTARQSLESHLMAFAADRARHERRVVAMAEYRG